MKQGKQRTGKGGGREMKYDSIDYNKMFSVLQEDCIRKNCCNAFAKITVDELVNLNNLLDRLIVFCENVDTDELEDCE